MHRSRAACVKQLIMAADAKALVDIYGDSAELMTSNLKLKSHMHFQTVAPCSFLHVPETHVGFLIWL